jgi:hypothetical protein
MNQLQGDVLEQAAAVARKWKYQQQSSSGYKQGLAGSWIQPGLLGHEEGREEGGEGGRKAK